MPEAEMRVSAEITIIGRCGMADLRKTGTEYFKHFYPHGGMDAASDSSSVSENRFAHIENMYRDYDSEQGSALETIPGFRAICDLGEKIYGIYHHPAFTGQGIKHYIFVHAGNKLYRFEHSERDNTACFSEIASGLNGEKSCAFVSDGLFYLLDGLNYYRIDANGVCERVGTDIEAYVPTVMMNGKAYEQRNMLSDKFLAEYRLSAVSDAAASEGLKFEIKDRELRTCTVIGIDDYFVTHLCIPSAAVIDGITYTVSEIGTFAFYIRPELVSVMIPETVERIKDGAFRECTGLQRIVIPDGVKEICDNAFSKCTSLTTVYLGSGIEYIRKNAFFGCTALDFVAYSGDAMDFSSVTADESFNYSVAYDIPLPESRVLNLAMPDGCNEILSVKISGEDIALSDASETVYYEKKTDGELVSEVLIFAEDKKEIIDKRITVSGTFEDYADNGIEGVTGFFVNNPAYSGTAFNAVSRCRCCAEFDGRMFFTANSALPNTVFYTARDLTGKNNPLYIGVYNYFNDGIGNTANNCIMSAGDMLMVFKESLSQDATVYYHTRRETDSHILPVIYPSTEGVSGVGAVGGCINFLDDPVFVSERGLDAIGKKAVNLERTVEHRSSNIDILLTAEKLSDARLAEWRGYLCLLVGSHIFLADSRGMFTHKSGDVQYEWYMLSDIGVYEGQEKLYTEMPEAKFDCDYVVFEGESIPLTYLSPDECRTVLESNERLYSLPGYFENESIGNIACLVADGENGEKVCIPCDFYGEMGGGSFSPAVEIFAFDGVLYFGCENGTVCCFNTDKRGIRHPSEPLDAYVDSSEISRFWYSFNGRRYNSGFKTAAENCSVPNCYKNTVPKSCVIKTKGIRGSRFSVRVRTDGGSEKNFGIANSSVFSFADLDFSDLSFVTYDKSIFPVREKEKRWIEKQFVINSNEFMRPFGFYGISYSYKVAGRIK